MRVEVRVLVCAHIDSQCLESSATMGARHADRANCQALGTCQADSKRTKAQRDAQVRSMRSGALSTRKGMRLPGSECKLWPCAR